MFPYKQAIPKTLFDARKTPTWKDPANMNTVQMNEIVLSFEDGVF